MTLDFHLALDKKEALYQEPNISIDSVLHSTIFERGFININMFPMFRKMADYYKDAKYNTEELKRLNSEIESIKQLFSENRPVVTFLENLSKISMLAQEKRLGVWVFCD